MKGEYENTGTHWIALFVKTNEAIYFDSFGIEYIPKEINRFIGNINITSNIFRIQAYDSIMCGYFCIEFINYSLYAYIIYFLLMILKRTIKLSKEYLWMNNISAHDTATKLSTSHLQLEDINKYRWNEINKTIDYFNNEINERKVIIKKLNKYLVSFDYLDKIFITLSASFGTLSIASYAAVVGIPVGIAGSSLTLIFTIGTGISKSLLKVTKKRKKKHNKIIALAKSKLNTIETLLSIALIDSKISHEEFSNIITEKNIYENIKENIKDTAELSSLVRIEEKSTAL